MRSLRTRVHLTASRMHKWLSLIIGLQVLIWMTSGLVMSALPIERVHGEHLVDRKAQPPITGVSAVRPLGELLSRIPGPVEEITLRMGQGRLLAEAKSGGRTFLFDPSTGARMLQISKDQAARIARESWKGGGNPEIKVTEVENLSPEFRGPLPAWQVTINDTTHVYVSRDTGRILAVRSSTWRLYDFFWSLHIMDWKNHQNFNTWWLLCFAIGGLISGLAGTVLLFMRWPVRRRRKVLRGTLVSAPGSHNTTEEFTRP